MKENEVRGEYLNIASSRVSRKGDRSIKKKRKVKGRKGIGKFAGLLIAELMVLETSAAGRKTTLNIDKRELAKANYDLEKVDLPLQVEEAKKDAHGTRVTLKGINQNLDFPNPDRLKQILMRDYGREIEFNILVNGEEIGVLDLPGKSFSREIELENGKRATWNYTVTEKPTKQSGIVTRVNNKVIGRPQNYLKDDEIIPRKLQGRVYGELICDDLEEDVTADYGAIIENSKLYRAVTDNVVEDLKTSLDDVFKTDMKLARARYKKKINHELQKLPEYRRQFAERYLIRVLEKFYDESEERINIVIDVMVDALEKDHYWNVVQNIQETRDGDIEKFADALSEFGFLEMSIISSQAINRLRFLDELDLLIANPATLEKSVHKAVQNSLWILGDDYSLIFSDTALDRAVGGISDKKYKGDKSKNRPDLFLGRKINRDLLLIEFKRPEITLNRDTEKQALEYRDELNTIFHNANIEIILIGGKVKQNIISHNEREDVKFRTYTDLITVARQRLEWLIQELSDDRK